MRYTLLILALIGYTISPFAQNTFIQPYDLDVNNVIFTSMLLDNDTLIVSGLVNAAEYPNQSGLLITKIDTNGHVIWTNLHFSAEGLNYSFNKLREGLTKAPDNSGYYELGHIFEHSTGVLIKYDKRGQFVWQREYTDAHSLQDHYQKIIATDDGLFISGTKVKLDYDLAAFVMKVDFEGNLQWEEIYEINGRDKAFNQMIKISDNEYVMGTTGSPVSTGQGPSPSDLFSTIFTSIDSVGYVLWEWESELSKDELGCNSFYFNENRTYMTKKVSINQDGSYEEQPRFVVRDSQFNLISSTLYDKPDYSFNNFYDMIPIQSGGFLAVGINTQDTTGLTYDTYNFGWMMRLDNDGNPIWERLDLTSIDTMATPSYWTSAIELESGSIIAVGSARTSINWVLRDWGSIIKVDKDGCIEMSCAIVGLDDVKVFQKEVTVYPNPFHNQINIDTDGKYQVAVFDLLGQMVFYQKHVDDFSNLDLSNLLVGTYFIKLIFEEGQKVFKVVKTE